MYCYLNCVYVDLDDVSKAYEVVKCDETFSKISIERVSLETLKSLAVSEEYETDFYFEEGYLKCVPVKRVWCDTGVEESLARHTVNTMNYTEESKESLYSLLLNGVLKGYYYLADELVGLEKYKGTGAVPFSHTKFSQSSMSIFFREVVNGVGKNHYVVSTEANHMKFEPFYFLVPAEAVEKVPYEFKGLMTVNNVEYKVYYSGTLSLAEPLGILSPVLLNKANCTRVRAASMVNCSRLVLDACYGTAPVEWDNSNHKNHNMRTVKFSSSLSVLTAKSASKIHKDVTRLQQDCSSLVELQQKLQEEGYVGIGLEAASMFGFITEKAEDETAVIVLAKAFFEKYSRNLFFADLFLYRLRAYYCYSGKLSIPVNTPICGGAESGITTIEEVIQ